VDKFMNSPSPAVPVQHHDRLKDISRKLIRLNVTLKGRPGESTSRQLPPVPVPETLPGLEGEQAGVIPGESYRIQENPRGDKSNAQPGDKNKETEESHKSLPPPGVIAPHQFTGDDSGKEKDSETK
jgi:hypothetical protein